MLLPSSHRPIPLVRRSDLIVGSISASNQDFVLVKDPLTLACFQLPTLQYQVLSALDGRRSLNDILCHIQRMDFASSVAAHDIFRFILDLASKRLIWSRRPGTFDVVWAEADVDGWRRFWSIVRNPFFIRLPGIYPGTVLVEGALRFGWIYSVPTLMAVALFVGLTWASVLVNLDALQRDIPSAQAMLSGHGLWMLWVVVGCLKVFHELSHGLACERFGSHCQSIGFAFLFFSPCMYCDVSDAGLLERKSHRIAISLAGVYVELFLSAVGFWCWRYSSPGILHLLGLQIFLAGSIATLLFNVNPLLKFDGYYVLSDVLEIPNLYQRSRDVVRQLAGRWFLGIRSAAIESDRNNHSRSVLLTYGLASMAYQIPMVIGIWLFFLRFFESIGLIAIPLGSLVITSMVLIRRFFSWGIAVKNANPSTRPSPVNTTLTTLFAGVGLVGLWFCPLGSSVTAPIVIEPRLTSPVYVETPGIVRRLYASEGDFVDEGTVLVELEDLSLNRRLAQLEGISASHEVDFRMAQSIGDPDLMTLAKTAQESVSEQLEQARLDQDRLILRATATGTVMSASSPDRVRETGVPYESALNPQLTGSYLKRRSCVCQIAPGSQWQAMILVDQRQRQHLSKGQSVTVRLDSYPGTNIRGEIQNVGLANEVTIPTVASSKFGGVFQTSSETHGEVPMEPVYRATILLEDVKNPVQAGMRGLARFSRPSMTLGSWLMDEIHRVFVVR